MKFKNRNLCKLLLAFILALQVSPMSVFAQETPGEVAQESSDISNEDDTTKSDNDGVVEDASASHSADTTDEGVVAVEASAQVVLNNAPVAIADDVIPEIDHDNEMIFANGVELHILAGITSDLTKVQYKDSSGTLIALDLDEVLDGVQEEANLENYTIYGGALNESVHSSKLVISGGDVYEVIGGGLSMAVNGEEAADANIETSTQITVDGDAIIANIYGGGNARSPYTTADVKNNTSIIVEANASIDQIVGGGYVFSTQLVEEPVALAADMPYIARVLGTTNIEMKQGEASLVIGGGFAANYYGDAIQFNPNIDISVAATNVTISEATLDFVYGGGASYNANSSVLGDTNVKVMNSFVDEVLGGALILAGHGTGSVQGTTNVNVEGGRIEVVYGGGALFSPEADVHTTEIAEAASPLLPNTTVKGNTQVSISSDVNQVYGGAKHGNVQGNTNVTILEGSDVNIAQAGGDAFYLGSSPLGSIFVPNYVFGNSTITVAGGIVELVTGGGGNQDNVYSVFPSLNGVAVDLEFDGRDITTNFVEGTQGNTFVNITGGQINYVIGGAIQGYVHGSTYVNITGGIIRRNVYAGGLGYSAVGKDTNVTMYGGTVANNIYGGGASVTAEDPLVAMVGYKIDFENTESDALYIANEGYGNATIKVFDGTIGYPNTTIIPGNVFVSGGYLMGYRRASVEPELQEIDLVSKNNGDGYVFINDDAYIYGNVYKSLLKEEIIEINGVRVNTKQVEGDVTVVMDQTYAVKSIVGEEVSSLGGVGLALLSLSDIIENDFDINLISTGTGLEYNGEGMNILRLQQLNEDALEVKAGEVLQSAAENGAWSMPHWSIQGDVVLHEDVVQNIAIIENQELYLPLDATLAVQGATPLSNEGYIVTAHGDLGNGLETGFVNNTTSNATSRIYRGDAANSMSVNPSVSNYKVNDSATPITASVGNNYTFLANGTKITYADTTWQKDGVAYSSTSGQITPTTDAAGVFTYTASTPFEVQFESVLQASGLMNNGNAQASAVVNVGLYNITFDPDGGVFPDGDTNAKVDMTDSSGKLTNTVTQPTKEGYTFEGWSIENEVISTQEAQDRVFTSDATLVAVWKKTSTSPTTGDTTNILLYMALVMFAIGGVMASKQQLKR